MCVERPCSPDRRNGFSLIELVIAIVVLGVGIAGLTLLFGAVTRESADPVLRKQAMAVAEGLMQEIVVKRFCSAACTPPAGRQTFDEVQDYAGYATNGVVSVDNLPVAGLEAYSVSVAVTPTALGAGARSVPAAAGVLVTVTVTWPGGSVALSGYRAAYAPDA